MKNHFFTHRAHTFLIVASLLVPLSVAFPQASTLSSTRYKMENVTGQLAKSGNINAHEAAKSAPVGGDAGPRVDQFRFPRLHPQIKFTGATSAEAPLAAEALATASATPSFRGFTGLTHLEQHSARGGSQFSTEPPDHGLAVGNGFVMQAVNSAINIYDTNGIQQLVRPLALTEFFGLPPAINRTAGTFGAFPGDPSCLFDPETQRWFVVAWAQLRTSTGVGRRESRLYLAVSQSSDPTGGYSIYTFNTTGANAPDANGPRVPDFPHFAVDHFGLYIGVNEFGITPTGGPGGFIGAAIIAVSKTALIEGTGGNPPTTVRFRLPFVFGFEFDVFPAYTPPGQPYILTNGGTQLFVSSQFVQDVEHQMAVWALANTSSLETSSPALFLSATVVNTQTYRFPALKVVQKNGFHPLGASLNHPVETLDPGDFRVLSCEYVRGQLWATLNSEARDSDGTEHEVSAYFAFSPRVQFGSITGAPVITQGVVAKSGVDLLYPAVALNVNLKGGIVFTLVGPDNYPSAAFAEVSGGRAGPVIIARAGNEPEDGFTGYPEFGGNGVARWGDYSAAAVNNVDNTIWMGTEYIPDIARSAFANWATYITRLKP
jgi:hypothetical protein